MKKTIISLTVLILLLFSFSLNVEAASSSLEWINGDNTMEISRGESTAFEFTAFTTQPPLEIKIELLDSQNNVIHTYEDKSLDPNLISFEKIYDLTNLQYTHQGEYSIRSHVIDNIDEFETRYIYLTVLKEGEGNQPPHLTITPSGNKEVIENNLLEFTVTSIDPEGDLLTIEASNLPAGATFDATQSIPRFTWTPNFNTIQHPDIEKDFEVTFKVFETNNPNNFDEKKVTIKVIDSNRDPTIEDVKNIIVTAGESAIVTPNANDPDDDTLTFKIKDSRFSQDNNIFTWQTSQDNEGTYSFILQIFDGFGGFLEKVFKVIVNPFEGDHTPKITSTPITEARVNRIYQYDVEATDKENDELIYSLSIYPEGMQINSQSGLITWIPNTSQLGENEVNVNVNDGNSKASQDFTIKVSEGINNTPPEITSEAITSAEVNKEYAYEVQAIDNENDPLTYSLKVSPSGMIINNKGIITWTPSDSQKGNQDVIIRVSDGLATTTQSYTVKVEDRGESQDKHKFSINNIQVKQTNKYLDIWVNLRNLGNQREKIKITATLNGQRMTKTVTLDINDARWNIIRLRKIDTGKQVVKIEARNSQDSDTMYRTIELK